VKPLRGEEEEEVAPGCLPAAGDSAALPGYGPALGPAAGDTATGSPRSRKSPGKQREVTVSPQCGGHWGHWELCGVGTQQGPQQPWGAQGCPNAHAWPGCPSPWPRHRSRIHSCIPPAPWAPIRGSDGWGEPGSPGASCSVCVHECACVCKRVYVPNQPSLLAAAVGSKSSLLRPPAASGLAGEDLVSAGEGRPRGKPVPEALGELEGHWGKTLSHSVQREGGDMGQAAGQGRAQPRHPGERDVGLEGAPQHLGVSRGAAGGSPLSPSLQAGGNGMVTERRRRERKRRMRGIKA